MKLKKILNVLIFLSVILSTIACSFCYAETSLEAQKRETREKINRLKWLESLETNKLYKNQQKLETATNNLASSKTQIISAQRELENLHKNLQVASKEYNDLNYILSVHIRSVFKSQRKAFFEILLNSEDINMAIMKREGWSVGKDVLQYIKDKLHYYC